MYIKLVSYTKNKNTVKIKFYANNFRRRNVKFSSYQKALTIEILIINYCKTEKFLLHFTFI